MNAYVYICMIRTSGLIKSTGPASVCLEPQEDAIGDRPGGQMLERSCAESSELLRLFRSTGTKIGNPNREPLEYSRNISAYEAMFLSDSDYVLGVPCAGVPDPLPFQKGRSSGISHTQESKCQQ